MHPKLVVLTALIIMAASFFVWIAGQVIERLTHAKFKCEHCRRRCYNSERDVWFADGICKTCGEYLIPHKNRNEEK